MPLVIKCCNMGCMLVSKFALYTNVLQGPIGQLSNGFDLDFRNLESLVLLSSQ